jgi:Carbohydrate family 9 binding domain-like
LTNSTAPVSFATPFMSLQILAVLTAVLGFACPLYAAYLEDWARMKSIKPREYVCHLAASPIVIDGKLDDAAWKSTPWTDDFVDIEGEVKPKPRFRTRAKMSWDSDYFYVAAELEEPHVWATLTNHDAVIFQDPDFEVFIAPDGDCHNYYEFEMNALNTGWDLRLPKPYKDGGPALNEWEIPGLKTAVQVKGTLNDASDHDRGWTLEIAFPWKALGEFSRASSPPNEGDQWRVGFSRVEWLIEIVGGKYRKAPGRREDNWIWSAQGIIDMHRPEKWGYVQFTRGKPGTVKFIPDVSAQARIVLQEIYYAQKDFHKMNNRWASSLDELKLPEALGKTLAQPLVLRATTDGFEVTTGIKLGNGNAQTWHIRQDAKVWRQ